MDPKNALYVILYQSADLTDSHNFFLTVHHHEDQPRRSHPEPEVTVHPESEEGRLQNLHLCHQRQPGQHLTPGWPSD